MFYQESQIKSFLVCKRCNTKYDETNLPKLLPCGHNICSNCESLLRACNNIKCKECSQVFSETNLPTNPMLCEILALTPNEIHRSDEVEEFKTRINQINNKVASIEQKLEFAVDTIKDHCINLRNQVQLATEIKLQQLNLFNENFISEIDKYEKECCAKFLNNNGCTQKYIHSIEEARKNSTKWKNYLNEFKIEDRIVKKNSLEAERLISGLDEAEKNLTDFIFNDHVLKFNSNKASLDDSILGTSSIIKMNSVILNTRQKMNLLKLFDFTSISEWNLLYRGSVEKFDKITLNSSVNKRDSILILIKSSENEIFGGYTFVHNVDNSDSYVSRNKKINVYSKFHAVKGSMSTSITYDQNRGFFFKFNYFTDRFEKSHLKDDLKFNVKNDPYLGSSLDGIHFAIYENLLRGNYYYRSAFDEDKDEDEDDIKIFKLSEIEIFTSLKLT